jgi:hypothetical protein
MGKKKSSESMPAVTANIPEGFEKAVIKFRRKPAKMGADYIFWIPRTYIRNGLVDPTVEYEIYLKRISAAPAPLPSKPAPPQDAPGEPANPDPSTS